MQINSVPIMIAMIFPEGVVRVRCQRMNIGVIKSTRIMAVIIIDTKSSIRLRLYSMTPDSLGFVFIASSLWPSQSAVISAKLRGFYIPLTGEQKMRCENFSQVVVIHKRYLLFGVW